MQISISDDQFKIDLDGWERFWAFYFNADLHIPLSHITQVSTDEPRHSWTDVRLPGTFLPGVIKAGTYYTDRGKEFWYVTRLGRYLTLELENEFYKRIVLSVEQNQYWAEQIHGHNTV
jgi:hypothetical protein